MNHEAPLIMVVDDDRDIREGIVEILREHGYQAAGAIHGADARYQLETGGRRPAAIVLDVMMPVMDGRAFHAWMARDPTLARIPILVISAYRDVAETAAELGAAGHLAKPIQLPDLLGTIERLVTTSTPA